MASRWLPLTPGQSMLKKVSLVSKPFTWIGRRHRNRPKPDQGQMGWVLSREPSCSLVSQLKVLAGASDVFSENIPASSRGTGEFVS